MEEVIFPILLTDRIENQRAILNEMVIVGIDQKALELSRELDILIAEYMKTQVEEQRK